MSVVLIRIALACFLLLLSVASSWATRFRPVHRYLVLEASQLSRQISEEDSLNALRALELGRRALTRGRHIPSVSDAQAEAEMWLNKGLAANKVTWSVLEETFEFPVSLSRFLDTLEKNYEYKEFGFVKGRYWLVSSKLEDAAKYFDEAIQSNPRLLDAYFEKIRIALDMDWRTEVIWLYEVARHLPIHLLGPDNREYFNLDPLGEVVEKLIFRVAKVYLEERNLMQEIRRNQEGMSGEGVAGKMDLVEAYTALDASEPEAIRLIQRFISNRKAILDSVKMQMEGDEDLAIALDNMEIWNQFTFARFYRDIGWRNQAEGTFDKEKAGLGPRLRLERDRYAFVAPELGLLERQVKNMKRTVSVFFRIDPELISHFGLSANVVFFPKARDENTAVTTEDLKITVIPGLRNDVSFREDLMSEQVTSHAISLLEGSYSVIVHIRDIPIQTPGRLPVQFIHTSRNMTSSWFLSPKLEMKILDRGRTHSVVLQKGQYRLISGALENFDGKQVTFPSGRAEIRATVDAEYLSDRGTTFGLSLQEVPGSFRLPLWRQPWLIGLMAGVLGVGGALAICQVVSIRRRRSRARESLMKEMEEELQTAHDMQMGLMPKENPRIEGFDVSGRCIPANHVGGDLFQYFSRNGGLSIAMADVTGHAMDAAIPVVMFSGVLDSQMEFGGEMEDILRRLNSSMCRNLDRRTFVCFALGEFSSSTGRLRLSNGGCPSPYHFQAATGEVIELEVGAYPLGVRPNTEYDVLETQFSPGDRIIFCSDGIIEADNADGAQFGYERTIDVIKRACRKDLSVEATIDRILEEVADFKGGAHQSDDMTCVVVRVEGVGEA